MHIHGTHLRDSLPFFLLLRNVNNRILYTKKIISEFDYKFFSLSTRWQCLYKPWRLKQRASSFISLGV